MGVKSAPRWPFNLSANAEISAAAGNAVSDSAAGGSLLALRFGKPGPRTKISSCRREVHPRDERRPSSCTGSGTVVYRRSVGIVFMEVGLRSPILGSGQAWPVSEAAAAGCPEISSSADRPGLPGWPDVMLTRTDRMTPGNIALDAASERTAPVSYLASA